MATAKTPSDRRLLLLSVALILFGWTMLNASADLRAFSLPGAVIMALGWFVLAWASSDAGSDLRTLAAALVAMIASIGLIAPMVVKRHPAIFAGVWALFLGGFAWLGYALTRSEGRRETIERLGAITAIVLGAIAQFAERRLNFEWLHKGEPAVACTAFNFGSVLHTLGWAGLAFAL